MWRDLSELPREKDRRVCRRGGNLGDISSGNGTWRIYSIGCITRIVNWSYSSRSCMKHCSNLIRAYKALRIQSTKCVCVLFFLFSVFFPLARHFALRNRLQNNPHVRAYGAQWRTKRARTLIASTWRLSPPTLPASFLQVKN
jgi:hypothetical protein